MSIMIVPTSEGIKCDPNFKGIENFPENATIQSVIVGSYCHYVFISIDDGKIDMKNYELLCTKHKDGSVTAKLEKYDSYFFLPFQIDNEECEAEVEDIKKFFKPIEKTQKNWRDEWDDYIKKNTVNGIVKIDKKSKGAFSDLI